MPVMHFFVQKEVRLQPSLMLQREWDKGTASLLYNTLDLICCSVLCGWATYLYCGQSR